MVRYYSADFVLPIHSEQIKNGVVAIEEDGTVRGVYSQDDVLIEGQEVQKLKGILLPGFVNTHCHLELSHLAGKIEKGQGLPQFLSQVMTHRGASDKEIQSAMAIADKTMFDRGIQAVGDHVNSAASVKVKSKSPIVYHSFVEVIGMTEENLQEKIDAARDTEYLFDHKQSSITLHAPYSCSKSLVKFFSKSVDRDNILSIHNQESDEENKLFRYKTGDFIAFYQRHNIDFTHFRAFGKDSVQSYVSFLPKQNTLILVHNTYTSMRDVAYLERISRNVYFCLCPKANLYIEDQLPHLNTFILSKQKITLGTDSLASNDTLDILEELKLLHESEPELKLTETLKWATLNGAEALGLEDSLGTLERGKKPGLILLENADNFKLTPDSKIRRIV